MQPSAVPLDRVLTLFEYDTCWDLERQTANPDQTAALYECRQYLPSYMTEKQKCLTRSFDGEKPCLRASHYVGLLPFPDKEGSSHLMMIAPKGCRQNWKDGLLRFMELLALGEDKDETQVEVPPGWKGKEGSHLFLLLLAHHYAGLLRDLCRRDFRSYYRHEEDDLRSRIRGRLHLAGYARRAVRGKPHILPCRWDEFTVDNWDNRVLWAAARRLKQIAGYLAPEAAGWVWRPFQRLLTWFGAVAEVPVTVHDLRKCRLGRTSRYYRRALAWAELLLRGSDAPTAGGQAPSLVLDSNKAFEKFAEVVVRDAMSDSWQCYPQEKLDFLEGEQIQTREPDILLTDSHAIHAGGKVKYKAVGDAKYKDVLEQAKVSELESVDGVLKVGIQPSDWNQLYVYMRIAGAKCGFFIVPFWDANGEFSILRDKFKFSTPPCGDNVRIAVLGLNLLRPLRDVKQDAADRLKSWLSE